MRDPQRLLRSGTKTEQELLQAAIGDEPSAHGEARLRAALGLTALVVGIAAASTSTAASGAAAPASAATLGGSLKASAAKLTLKWALIAVSGVGVASMAVVVTRPAPAAHEQLLPKSRSHAAPQNTLPTEVSAPAEAPTSVPVRATAPRTMRHRSAATAPSIAGETARLDAARTAIRRRQPHLALAMLNHYAREHPRGVLRQEARLLRVQALALAGDLKRARALGQRFLHDNPNSPHAERVRAIVRSAPDAP